MFTDVTNRTCSQHFLFTVGYHPQDLSLFDEVALFLPRARAGAGEEAASPAIRDAVVEKGTEI